ncbi:MAG: Ig-like domain-containing protein [Candidatus Dormibacter sp.]
MGENAVWFALFKAAALKLMALGAMLSPLAAPAVATQGAIPSPAVRTGNPQSAPAPAGIGVFVGYGDSLRADPANFPTPWFGSPRTSFEGCAPTTACVYDAGAVRIVNNSSSPATINAVAVHIDTCTFSGWPAATLAPGNDLIVTQRATEANDLCAPTQMDTSDIGPGGSSYTGNCTPDGIQPVVDVTVNGATTSYTDSGQVLNTGGIDAGICSGNESIQWTVIGHAPCRGSLLSLTPPAQSHQVLSTATVTATFTNSCGQPLSNTAVQFSALSGPNAGLSGSGVTNASGQASFTYTGTKLGTDTWRASVSNLAGSIPSNPATVTWTLAFAGSGGSFVIGDLENVANGHILYWGAQWWKQDLMSKGPAPAAFKGLELSNPPPACGQTWTTRPGNSPHPPATVPAVMGVIVSSHITQKGSAISGDILHIVVVRTDPGYGPNPGHAGTGTIIATIC